MKVIKTLCQGLALGGMLLLGSGAHATNVSYVTTGTFSGGDLAGTSTYQDAAHGISITFNSAANDNVSVPPTSQVSFGTFNTSATTATTFAPVSSGFTLSIFETGPTTGTLTFLGQLSGTLRINNSQAFVQFSGPLAQSLGVVTYTITSADNGTPGRVNIAPPTTNGGNTTIVGTVGAAGGGVIPEPSTWIMLGMGAPAFLVVVHRNRKKAGMAA
jgi:hypothetical protein